MVEIKSCHTEALLPVTAVSVSPAAAPHISPSGVPAPTLVLLKNSQTTISLLIEDQNQVSEVHSNRSKRRGTMPVSNRNDPFSRYIWTHQKEDTRPQTHSSGSLISVPRKETLNPLVTTLKTTVGLEEEHVSTPCLFQCEGSTCLQP